jgi:hypothetical protein
MPIEEWLFFFVIPFYSFFIHFGVTTSFPNFKLRNKITRLLAMFFIVIYSVLLVTHLSKAYTLIYSIPLLLVLTLGIIFHLKQLQRFFYLLSES